MKSVGCAFADVFCSSPLYGVCLRRDEPLHGVFYTELVPTGLTMYSFVIRYVEFLFGAGVHFDKEGSSVRLAGELQKKVQRKRGVGRLGAEPGIWLCNSHFR